MASIPLACSIVAFMVAMAITGNLRWFLSHKKPPDKMYTIIVCLMTSISVLMVGMFVAEVADYSRQHFQAIPPALVGLSAAVMLGMLTYAIVQRVDRAVYRSLEEIYPYN